MKLNQQQIQQVQNWIKQKGMKRCVICEGQNFQEGYIVAAADYTADNTLKIEGGNFIPMVQLIYRNCGHIFHFSTLKIGLNLTTDDPQLNRRCQNHRFRVPL